MNNNKRLQLPHVPRREEEAKIREAWDHIHDGVQVVFLSGASGTGKSTFVSQAINAAMTNKTTTSSSSKTQRRPPPRFQCLRASTKFDQKRACAPLSGLRQLVSELVLASTRTCGRALRDKISQQQYQVLQSFMMTSHVRSTRKLLLPSSTRRLSTSGLTSTRMIMAEISEDSKEEEPEDHDSRRRIIKQDDHNSNADDDIDDNDDDDETATTADLDVSHPSQENAQVNKDSRTLLTTTLKAVLRAIASASSVILTIDDLHWSCITTLEVLQKIVTDPHLSNVLVCATYRTDEPAATEGFYHWKDQLQASMSPAEEKKSKAIAQTINFDNLELPAVQELLAEAVSREMDDVADLAETVFGFTHGNLFFLKHFLERLQDDQLLTFDFLQYRWVWNVRAIRQRGSLTDNVVQILAARMHKLSQPVQNVLLLASCFGAQFDVRALEAAKSALGVDSAYRRIAEARQHELVVPIRQSIDNDNDDDNDDEEVNTQYKFAHDMIQFAAYGMFPDDTDMDQVHWNIGRLLMQDEELLQCNDCILFATVDHLNMKGSDALPTTSQEEDATMDDARLKRQLATVNLRIQLADLNYRAGCKAATLSAFGPAAGYIQAGIAALGDDPFGCSYELAYKLFTMAAKTEYVGGNIDASQAAAQQVLDHAKTYEEKLPLLMVMFDCYQARSNPPKLLDFSLEALRQLGEQVEENPNKMKVQWEFKKMQFQVQRLTDERILELPPMTDYKKETVLQLMYKLIFPLYQMEKQRLCTLITCRMISITLKYGLSKSLAPHSFVMAATFIISQNQDIEEGYRLGKLAEKIIAQQGVDPGNSTILCYLGHLNKWWREPVPNCLDSFIECNKLAMNAGQVGNAFQSTVGYGVNYFYSGLPLGPLLADMEQFGSLYLEYNQIMFYLLATPIWQCILNLMGKSEDPTSMEKGAIMERRKAFPNHKKCGAQSVQSFQMIISYYMGDLKTATEMADKLVDCKPGIMGASFWYSSRRFFLGLIAIANYRLTQKRKDKLEAEKQLKFFKKVVKKGAINLLHKLQLLKAEMVTIEANLDKPKELEAIVDMYDEAIVSATKAGFLQDAALANYLSFQFCNAHNVRMHMSELYLKKSIEHWVAWGAIAVANSIATRHEEIFGADSALSTISELKDASVTMSGSMRSRPRFDAALALQHKELRV